MSGHDREGRRASGARSSDAAAILDRAQASLAHGHALEAHALLLDALKNYPADAGLRHVLGVAQFRLQRFGEAESTFRQVIAGRPDHYQAIYYLGLVLERQGRQAEALSMFRTALALRPDFEKAREKLSHTAATTEGQVPATRPLSALIEGTERTREAQSRLPGELLFSGRRRLSSFAGHILTVVLLLGAATLLAGGRVTARPPTATHAVKADAKDLSGKSDGAKSPDAELAALTLREQQLQDRVDELTRRGAPRSELAPAREQLMHARGERLQREGELKGVQFREEIDKEREQLHQQNSLLSVRSGLSRIAPGVLAFAAALVLAHLVLAYLGTSYHIFERRIDIRKGGLGSTSESVWHYEIRDVQLRRTLLMQLTGNARIVLQTDDGQRDLPGLAPASVMERMWREIRDAVLVERREMKKIWI